eukprot:ANDGO_08622.mRNA.1 hypothetical protein CAOG_00660
MDMQRGAGSRKREIPALQFPPRFGFSLFCLVRVFPLLSRTLDIFSLICCRLVESRGGQRTRRTRMSKDAKINKVGIIGGGIGGLVLAQFLAAKSPELEISVFDRDDCREGRGQGYYLGINNAAIQAFETRIPSHADIQRIMHDGPNQSQVFTMLNGQNKVLATIKGARVFVDRCRFRDALLQGVENRVFWNKKFTRYEDSADGSEGVTVHFADGSSEQFDVIVGADGANSVFRKQYVSGVENLSKPLKYSDLGFTSVAGLVSLSSSHVSDYIRERTKPGLVRWLGENGHTVMMFQFHEPRIATSSAEPETHLLWVMSFPGEIDAWNNRFMHPEEILEEEYALSLHFRQQLLQWVGEHVESNGFSADVVGVLKGTPADSRLYGPRQIYSLPPESIKQALFTNQKFSAEHLKRVFILGDAAHATTTHRGLGANTAIMDAAELCDALIAAKQKLDNGDPVCAVSAFLTQEYDLKMANRAAAVVAGSIQSTHMIHATGFFARWVRPFMLGIFHYVFKFFPSMTD